jgi:ankyrin repeat protein
LDLKDFATIDQPLGSEVIPVDVNQYIRGRTALSLATEHEMHRIMEKLLPKADIDKEDDDDQKRTPLAWAIERIDLHVVKILFANEKKPHVIHRNPGGRTPFSLAAEVMGVGIMAFLLKQDAEPHAEDDIGHTAFWWFLKINLPG